MDIVASFVLNGMAYIVLSNGDAYRIRRDTRAGFVVEKAATFPMRF